MYKSYFNMEEIQKVITEIELKITSMRNALTEVRTTNVALKNEVEKLQKELALRSQEAQDFKAKYDDLMQQYQQREGDSTVSQPDNNAEIDALVREIDDCISRLKAEN